MVARKTKRVAVVTAVSASLVMAGAAAFAQDHEEPTISCPRPGNGQGHGHPGNGKGNGATRGWWHKCANHDNTGGSNGGGSNGGGSNGGGSNGGGSNGGGSNGGGSNGGGSNGGGSNGGGSNGGGTNSDNDVISIDVNVEVNLPNNIVVPNAATAVDGVLDHALVAAGQTVTLAESDVARVMAIVGSAGQGATSLVTSTAQAGVSLSGTGASGSINVSGGAAGATTLGSNLLGSTLNFVSGNVSGGGNIAGTMLSML